MRDEKIKELAAETVANFKKGHDGAVYSQFAEALNKFRTDTVKMNNFKLAFYKSLTKEAKGNNFTDNEKERLKTILNNARHTVNEDIENSRNAKNNIEPPTPRYKKPQSTNGNKSPAISSK